MIARYDLKYELLGFDFFGWLVIAAARGATEIVFGTREIKESIWPAEVIWRRFESIIRPGPALAGLPWREGDDGERLDFGAWPKFKLPRLVEFCKERSFPRLRSYLPPAEARYTVTLRQYDKSPYRNSDEQVWRTFAAEIGATVIEDYSVEPIHLYERMALYAGAQMNFGVASGPMFLCTLTDYPCMSFDWGLGPQKQVLELSGIPAGSNLPWCGDNQYALWKPDDLSTIRKSFEAWNSGQQP